MFPQRPKSVKEEDEEDLLRAQQEFLALKQAGKIQPSVSQVIKTYSEESKGDVHETPIEPRGSLSFDPQSLSAIGELPIVELNPSNFSGYSFPKKVNIPFPKPTRLAELSSNRSTCKNPESSGPGNDYQRQNDTLIAKMSSEQIQSMREEIMGKLKPDQIEFLRNRRKKQTTEDKNVPPAALSRPAPCGGPVDQGTSAEMAIRESRLAQKTGENDLPIPLTVIKQQNWLHMDVIEEDKLEWCRPLRNSETASATSSARFDFSGNIIMDSKKSSLEGLHHHGEEADRPGYSLPEIYTFIQSSFDSQRLIGLKILARIMDKTHKGYYDNFFNTILAQEILDNTEIILSIRKCLDDSAESVIREAVLCLHALICNNLVDEPCLDRFFPVTLQHNDFLFCAPAESEKKINYDELKDDQLARLDVIKGLIRFDTLPRLRYLLDNNVKHRQDPILVNKLMEILIRIARHSPKACNSIVNCPYLIETIVTHFVPKHIDFTNRSIYGNPLPKALKLLRLLISDTTDCIQIFNTYPQLWDSMQIYLTLDPDCFREDSSSLKRVNVLQIAIETLRVWCLLLSNPEIKPAKDCFNQLYPIIYKQLQYCCTLTPTNHRFDFQYAATLVKCLTWATEANETLSSGYGSLVQSILFQSVRDIIDIAIVPPFDTLMMMTACTEFLLKTRCKPTALIINLLNPLLDSEKIMKILGSRLKKCSFIARPDSYRNGTHRDASCLPSFGTIYFGGSEIRFVGLAQDDSVVFFIESLLGAAEFTQDRSILAKLILNPHLLNYIGSVITSGSSFKAGAIFTQIEFTLIYQICISSLKVMINEEQLFYNLSLVSLYHLKDSRMKENLLNLILFNPNLLTKLSVSESVTLESVESIKTIYFEYSNFETHLWLFDPILVYFNHNSNPKIHNCDDGSNENLTSKKTKDLIGALKFIHFSLLTNEQLITSMVPLGTIFCLIGTIYLIEDCPFTDETISSYLRKCLTLLDRNNLYLNETVTKLPHISSYLHFFELLVKQFESESFGDSVFINYLLVFLKPQSNSEFTKKLLSEFTVSLRFIQLDSKDNLILHLNHLLYPPVLDLTLIELFLSNLLCNQIPCNRKSLIYLISVHHVHHALFKVHPWTAEDRSKVEKYLLSIGKCQNVGLKDHLTNFISSDLRNICDWAVDWTQQPRKEPNHNDELNLDP